MVLSSSTRDFPAAADPLTATTSTAVPSRTRLARAPVAATAATDAAAVTSRESGSPQSSDRQAPRRLYPSALAQTLLPPAAHAAARAFDAAVEEGSGRAIAAAVPSPPPAGPVGSPAFFSGLAAGDDMACLVHTLRRCVATRCRERIVDRRAARDDGAFFRAANVALVLSAEHPAAAEAATFLYFSVPTRGLKRRVATGRDDEERARHASRQFHGLAAAADADGADTAGQPFHASVVSLCGDRLRAVLSAEAAAVLARRLLRQTAGGGGGGGGAVTEAVRSAWSVLTSVEATPEVLALLLECYHAGGQWRDAVACLEALPVACWTEREVSLTVQTLYHAALHGDLRDSGQTPPGASPRHAPSVATSRRTSKAAPRPLPPPSISSAAGRRLGTGSPRTGPHPSESAQAGADDLACVLSYPLQIFRTARANHMPFSSSAAVNDALGLLAMQPKLWREAIALLEEMLLAPSQQAWVGEGASPAGRKGPSPSVRLCREEAVAAVSLDTASDLALLGRVRAGRKADCVIGRVPSRAVGGSGGAAKHDGHDGDDDDSLRYLRANAVTLYQACRALRGQPALAYTYATRLVHVHALNVAADFRATEAYLHACVREGKWQEALRVVGTVCREDEPSPHPRARDAGGVAANMHSREQPLSSSLHRAAAPRWVPRPDLLLSLVKLLAETPSVDPAARTRLFALLLLPCPRTDAKAAGTGPGGSLSGAALSSLYNPHTLSRAYNTMIQHARTLAEADACYDALRRALPSPLEGNAAPAESKDLRCVRETAPPTSTSSAVSGREGDERLENESYERLAILCSRAGQWERALRAVNVLLHSPRRRVLYNPTTTLHDAVQYALELSSREPTGRPAAGARAAARSAETASTHLPAAAPPTGGMRGASWQVAVGLLHDMCDRRVPISAVAFQSVVKTCFAHGAADEAQRLFVFMMQHGVRR